MKKRIVRMPASASASVAAPAPVPAVGPAWLWALSGRALIALGLLAAVMALRNPAPPARAEACARPPGQTLVADASPSTTAGGKPEASCRFTSFQQTKPVAKPG